MMDYTKFCIVFTFLASASLCVVVYWNLPSVREERKLRNLFRGLSQHCGPALRYFRERKRQSEKELSKMLSETAPFLYIDEVTIIVIEQGDLVPDFRVLRAIGGVLNFSINDLIWQMARLNSKKIANEGRHREPVYG